MEGRSAVSGEGPEPGDGALEAVAEVDRVDVGEQRPQPRLVRLRMADVGMFTVHISPSGRGGVLAYVLAAWLSVFSRGQPEYACSHRGAVVGGAKRPAARAPT